MSSPIRQRPGTRCPNRRGAKAADEPQAQADPEPKGLTYVELVDATLSAGPRRSARNQKAEPPSQPPPSSEQQQQQRAKGQQKQQQQKQQQRHQQPVLETAEGPAAIADEEMAGKEKEAEDGAPAPGRRGGRAAGGRKRATEAASGDAAQPPEAAAGLGPGEAEGEGVGEEQRPQRQERPFDAFAAPGKEVLHREASDVGGSGDDGEGEGAEGAAGGGAGAAEAPRGGRKGAAAGRPPKRTATGKRSGGSAASAARSGPTRDLEIQLQAQGYVAVGGADEAGRGPLAGPVVAAVVVLPPLGDLSWRPPAGLNDSKAMSEEEREAVYEQLIIDPRVKWAVSVVDHQEIDRVNILQAALGAMRQSAVKLLQQHQQQKSGTAAASIAAPPPPPALDFLLVDGNRLPKDLPVPGRTVVKGDATVSCIAAASCIAKVTRDRLMLQLDEQYPQYGFAQHKGYGVPAHMEAIRRHGPSAVHRRSFEPVKSMTGWSREAMLRELQEEEDEGERARQPMAGQKPGQGQMPVPGASKEEAEEEAARGVAKAAGDRRVPGARTRADGASGGKRPGTRGRGRGRAAEEEQENVSEEEGNEEQAEESGEEEEEEEEERPRRKAARVLQGSGAGGGVRGRGRAGAGSGSARAAQQGAGVAEAQPPAAAQDTAAAPVSRGGRPRRKSAGKGACGAEERGV